MIARRLLMTRRYSEMMRYHSYDERLRYLHCPSDMFAETFGPNRYFNQSFYKSHEWKRIRRDVILRDNGCDLAIPELPIRGRIIIHHLMPITMEDILHGTDALFDPENLICCSIDTHNAIHYVKQPDRWEYEERTMNDTSPWRNSL